jgi:hypothetical protein
MAKINTDFILPMLAVGIRYSFKLMVSIEPDLYEAYYS